MAQYVPMTSLLDAGKAGAPMACGTAERPALAHMCVDDALTYHATLFLHNAGTEVRKVVVTISSTAPHVARLAAPPLLCPPRGALLLDRDGGEVGFVHTCDGSALGFFRTSSRPCTGTTLYTADAFPLSGRSGAAERAASSRADVVGECVSEERADAPPHHRFEVEVRPAPAPPLRVLSAIPLHADACIATHVEDAAVDGEVCFSGHTRRIAPAQACWRLGSS